METLKPDGRYIPEKYVFIYDYIVQESNTLVVFPMQTDCPEKIIRQLLPVTDTYDNPDDVMKYLLTLYPGNVFEDKLDFPNFTNVLFDLVAVILRIYGKGPTVYTRMLNFGTIEQDEALQAYLLRKYNVHNKTIERVFYTNPGNFMSLVNFVATYNLAIKK